MKTLIFLTSLFALSYSQLNPYWLDGRNTIVHLFEWKWTDIADECERFLGPRGFAGVQISPPSENIIIPNRPWYERYQPISYKLNTRSGNEKEFSEMTRRCNLAGIRIYADVVINHMAAFQSGNPVGTDGSTYDSSLKNFPAVPYSALDFNTNCGINDYQNIIEVRNCGLSGLPDLNQGVEWVRLKITEYLNHLISLGVAGFRVDACKHMWPEDLKLIFNGLTDLNTSYGFPPNSRPFITQEVIDMGGNEKITKYEYTSLGTVTEFRFSEEIGKAFRGRNSLKWLKNFGTDWGFLPSTHALTFVDNHDNQRGHGGGGANVLTYKDSKNYKMATAFHLAWPFGISRIMSSFAFETSDQGPPADSKGNLISPQFNEDGACINGFVCEHRWRQIYNMIKWKNVAGNEPVRNWWDNWSNQIAFSRGNRAFIAFNLESGELNRQLQTGLPAGVYCDIVSGKKKDGKCSGKSISVAENGMANIYLPGNEEDGFIATHTDEKL